MLNKSLLTVDVPNIEVFKALATFTLVASQEQTYYFLVEGQLKAVDVRGNNSEFVFAALSQSIAYIDDAELLPDDNGVTRVLFYIDMHRIDTAFLELTTSMTLDGLGINVKRTNPRNRGSSTIQLDFELVPSNALIEGNTVTFLLDSSYFDET